MAKPALRRFGRAPLIPLSRMALDLAHPLRAGLRFCIVCQGGVAVDLVTGAKATVSGTFAERTFQDGHAADFDGSDYFEFPDLEAFDITGDLTLVWRGILDDTGDAALCCKATSDAGYNSPFYLNVSSAAKFQLIRTNATEFSFWDGPSVSASAPITLGVSNPAVSNASCTFYVNGAASAGSLLFSAGATSVTANAQPLRIGRDIAGTPKQLDGGASIIMGWQRQLTAAQHTRIHRNPYALIVDKRDRRAFVVAAAGATIAAGLATEIDTAFGIGWSKSRTAGLAAESDAALAATARRIQALGLTVESDAALAAGHARAQAVGLAGETDTALAATARRTTAAGLAAETDSAPAAGHAKAATAGQAGETDTAPPVSAGAGVPVGLAAETDTAPAAGHSKAGTAGLAVETDEALGVTATGGAAPAIGGDWLVLARRRGRR